jgi:FMN phosphatase YigB (HAD superfamily)
MLNKGARPLTTLTILLDLDNTLLGNDMNKFLPPYFAGLQKRLQEFTDEPNLWQITIASVQVMQANQDPTVTNLDAFLSDFTRRLGQPLEAIQPMLETFYREDYPHLQKYTTHWPEGQVVIRRLLADGHNVVVATNPLFPSTAVEQRMEWAGVGDFPYALVTTMENSHFSKPNLKYYQEILIQTNSTPETTWMVGDDPDNDIAPARALGLKTWWMTHNANIAKAQPACDKQGSLSDFLTWLETGGLKQ